MRKIGNEYNIAYLVQRFPALRTTFIRREVDALRQMGTHLQVISMRRAEKVDLCGDKEAEAHLSTTQYLPTFPLDPESLWCNFVWLITRPLIYLAVWRLAWSDSGRRGFLYRFRLLLQIWRGAIVARRLQRLSGQWRIHAQFSDGAATTGLVAAKLLQVPFSFMSHTSHDSPVIVEKIHDARFIASISQFDRQQLLLKSDQSFKSKIHIVHCGIPIKDWPYRERHPRNQPSRIVSTGALNKKKGHDVLIEACGFLRSAGVQFCCEIIGGGELQRDLESLIYQLNLNDYVKLLGPLPQSEVRAKLYGADLFVLACRVTSNNDMDGIPVSLMEAMAVGVPVVSTSISGITELIHCDWGNLVPPENPASLAESMRTSLVNINDVQLRKARQWVETQFNQTNEAQKLCALLGMR